MMSSLTFAMTPLSPAFSAAIISGVSKVITICFIPCLSRLQAKLPKKQKGIKSSLTFECQKEDIFQNVPKFDN